MTSKEALEAVKENKFNEMICTMPPLLAYNGKTREEMFELIKHDLEVLENLEAKTHLLYKDRKAIAKEFDKWCEENKAVNCSENMATWFLSIKLKEWLEK